LQGNCLLVGVGGSGKQSLARLAAYAAGCGVFEITLTRGYDEVAFREDLKKLYTMLGAENKKMVFLFTDSHVADEGFLKLINNMLTTGEHCQHAACIQVCMPRTEFTDNTVMWKSVTDLRTLAHEGSQLHLKYDLSSSRTGTLLGFLLATRAGDPVPLLPE
jgi:hypothetical protein